MSKKVVQQLQITKIEPIEGFQHVATVDVEGNIGVADLRIFGGVDGGSAESKYLAHQNITGGSAVSLPSFKIGGGNAFNN